MEKVAIGADHAGFELKEALKRVLAQLGLSAEDYGCASKDSVDYPDYAKSVGEAVAGKKAQAGILICGTGIGMCIAANKVAGVRAALVSDLFTAQMSREHNDANVLVLGAKMTDPIRAEAIVRIWFASRFEGGRHARRIGKIEKMEKE